MAESTIEILKRKLKDVETQNGAPKKGLLATMEYLRSIIKEDRESTRRHMRRYLRKGLSEMLQELGPPTPENDNDENDNSNDEDRPWGNSECVSSSSSSDGDGDWGYQTMADFTQDRKATQSAEALDSRVNFRLE